MRQKLVFKVSSTYGTSLRLSLQRSRDREVAWWTNPIKWIGATFRCAKTAKWKAGMLARNLRARLMVASYLRSNRRPWRLGYNEYKMQYLRSVIDDEDTLKIFRENGKLPDGYGFRLDARVVEIPWVLSRVAHRSGPLLDGGSSLNYEFLLNAQGLRGKKITMLTLAPEAECYWNLGVSYVFGDLRNLDFRSDLFDTIVCISTMEHVGMDNTIYTSDSSPSREEDPNSFLLAVRELRRVLKPGGVLYITVPFGRYEDHSWFQQFDFRLLETLITEFRPKRFHESIFRYNSEGWNVSDRVSCAHCRYFDVRANHFAGSRSWVEHSPDYAVAERAVACLELFK